MSRCDRMVDVGRRRFMSGAGLAAAGVAVTSITPSAARAAPAAARVDYPVNRLANVKDLKINEPLSVSYPDANAPGVLLKLGGTLVGKVAGVPLQRTTQTLKEDRKWLTEMKASMAERIQRARSMLVATEWRRSPRS